MGPVVTPAPAQRPGRPRFKKGGAMMSGIAPNRPGEQGGVRGWESAEQGGAILGRVMAPGADVHLLGDPMLQLSAEHG